MLLIVTIQLKIEANMLSFVCNFPMENNLMDHKHSKFGDYVDLIYLIKFEIKDTTYIARSAS